MTGIPVYHEQTKCLVGHWDYKPDPAWGNFMRIAKLNLQRRQWQMVPTNRPPQPNRDIFEIRLEWNEEHTLCLKAWVVRPDDLHGTGGFIPA